MSGHTPGPWRWEVNLNTKNVHLCGGDPKGAFGSYDLSVMDFKRWGIQSAQPVFWDWNAERHVGTPYKASEIAQPVPGREHHEGWFRTISHPDARLIAAAPEMFEALKRIAEPLDCGCVPCRSQCRSQHALEIELEERQDIARAAIVKATVAFGREGV